MVLLEEPGVWTHGGGWEGKGACRERSEAALARLLEPGVGAWDGWVGKGDFRVGGWGVEDRSEAALFHQCWRNQMWAHGWVWVGQAGFRLGGGAGLGAGGGGGPGLRRR